MAGIAEVSLKKVFSDKTNWRKMLQNEHEEVQWEKAINQAIDLLPNDLKPYIISGSNVIEIDFPVLQYPKK